MTRDNSQMTLEVFGPEQSTLADAVETDDETDDEPTDTTDDLAAVAVDATGETPEPRIIDDDTTPAVAPADTLELLRELEEAA